MTTSQLLYAQLCLKSYTGHNCRVSNVCGLLYFSHTIVNLSAEIKSSSDKSLLSEENVPKGFELSMCFAKNTLHLIDTLGFCKVQWIPLNTFEEVLIFFANLCKYSTIGRYLNLESQL